MIYYSKSRDGFFPADIHGDNIPSDGIEVTLEYQRELMAGAAIGKKIVISETGSPILQDPEPTPELTELQIESNRQEYLQANAIPNAKAYLASTDWYVARFSETGKPIPQEVLDARAEARLTLS